MLSISIRSALKRLSAQEHTCLIQPIKASCQTSSSRSRLTLSATNCLLGIKRASNTTAKDYTRCSVTPRLQCLRLGGNGSLSCANEFDTGGALGGDGSTAAPSVVHLQAQRQQQLVPC